MNFDTPAFVAFDNSDCSLGGVDGNGPTWFRQRIVPSTDAQASYAALSQTLTSTLDAWRQLKRVDLATLNAQFKAAGEKPVALR